MLLHKSRQIFGAEIVVAVLTRHDRLDWEPFEQRFWHPV